MVVYSLSFQLTVTKYRRGKKISHGAASEVSTTNQQMAQIQAANQQTVQQATCDQSDSQQLSANQRLTNGVSSEHL